MRSLTSGEMKDSFIIKCETLENSSKKNWSVFINLLCVFFGFG